MSSGFWRPLGAAVLVLVTCPLSAYSYSGGTGEPNSPYQIADANDWQELMETSSHWSKSFVLIADVNLAGVTVTPVGNSTTPFTGYFDGDARIIINAMTNLPSIDYVGLFGYVSSGGQIHHLGTETIKIVGKLYVGALVGWNYGSITNCHASGTVNGTTYVGGLVGYNFGKLTSCYATSIVIGNDAIGGLCGRAASGTITDCYATGDVTGNSYVGGLCGSNWGSIKQCYSTGGVIASTYIVGGLCGTNQGVVSLSHASGAVTGSNYVGGLCGYNFNFITACHATGSVTGSDYVGGLCGNNPGPVSQSRASGAVTGSNYVGGLCGYNYNFITACHATGSVTGNKDYVGGLCGYSANPITQSYACGAVKGKNYVGGICGHTGAPISQSYATGAVTGIYSYVGGLVGSGYKNALTACFWDIETSGLTDGVGNQDPDPSGATGKTTAEMQDPNTFILASWDFLGDEGGTVDTWRMCVDLVDYPHLTWEYVDDGDFACPNGVGKADLARLANDWLLTYSAPLFGADATGDSTVNFADFAILAANWTQGP